MPSHTLWCRITGDDAADIRTIAAACLAQWSMTEAEALAIATREVAECAAAMSLAPSAAEAERKYRLAAECSYEHALRRDLRDAQDRAYTVLLAARTRDRIAEASKRRAA